MQRIFARSSCYVHLVLCQAMLLLGIAGCMPDAIVWTPDSNSIIYTDTNGSRLIEHNLLQKSTRVIVADTDTRTFCPAISRDGKRLAVARIVDTTSKDSFEGTMSAEVLIYDREGKQLQRSSPLKRTYERGFQTEFGTKVIQAGLNWSGPANKILLANAIYDCETDSWIELPQLTVFPFNNLPVRPDGQGLLAMDNESQKIYFVDWRGHARSAELPQEKELIGFTWKQNLARFEFSEEICELDTDTMTFSNSPQRDEFLLDGFTISGVHRFDRTGISLRLFSRATLPNEEAKSGWRLEREDPKAGGRNTLIEVLDIQWTSFLFYPSPDGKQLAIRYRPTKDEGGSKIVIIDEQGSIVTTLDTK